MKAPIDPPPEVPGYTFRKEIAAGGFADVFLYLQQSPRRQVALKVLQFAHVSPDSRGHFEHEANTMAEVSMHSNIVSILASGEAPDGRPYIVMEYWPGERFDIKARGGQLPVHQVLDVGIRVASAVETAHRAGIFHRDIKPENILTTREGRPGLTDFGISAVRRVGFGEGAAGYTPQFAPPEVIRDPFIESTTAADIYCLGSTLFYLLEGRPAYFVHGEANGNREIEARTLAGPVPTVERSDVPPILRNLIRNAMSPDPASRPVSALAFAQGLQDVQQELLLPVTQPEVLEVAALPEDFIPDVPTPDRYSTSSNPSDAGATRGVGGVTSIPPASSDPLENATRAVGARPASPPSSGSPDTRGAADSSTSAPVARSTPPRVEPLAPADDHATRAVGHLSTPPTSTPVGAPPPSDATVGLGNRPATIAIPPSPPRPGPSSAGPEAPPAVQVVTTAPEPDGDVKDDDTGKEGRASRPIVVGAIAATILIVVAAVLGSGTLGGGAEGTTTTSSVSPPPVGPPASPSDVKVSRDASGVKASWTESVVADDEPPIDAYRLAVSQRLGDGTIGAVTEPASLKKPVDVGGSETGATLEGTADHPEITYCVEVLAVREGLLSLETEPVCEGS